MTFQLFLRMRLVTLICSFRLLTLSLLQNCSQSYSMHFEPPHRPDFIVCISLHLISYLVKVVECTFNLKHVQIRLELICCYFASKKLLNSCCRSVFYLFDHFVAAGVQSVEYLWFVKFPSHLNFLCCLISYLFDQVKPPLTFELAPAVLNPNCCNLLLLKKHLPADHNLNSSGIEFP